MRRIFRRKARPLTDASPGAGAGAGGGQGGGEGEPAVAVDPALPEGAPRSSSTGRLLTDGHHKETRR